MDKAIKNVLISLLNNKMINKLCNTCEIVVAHYNEDLKWLKPYEKKAIVYHKGGNDFPKIECKEWIKLPNIWRESHTYLYYIVNNYNNLPEYILFFQWWIKDHAESWDVYESVEEYLNEVEKYWFSCANPFFLVRKDPQINFTWKFAEMLESWSLKKSPYTFARFYKELLGKSQKYLTPCFWAANFAVSRDVVKERPLSFYKKALELLPEHPNPEEWHFYERLRFSIFNAKYNLHTMRKLFSHYFDGLKKRFSRIIYWHKWVKK